MKNRLYKYRRFFRYLRRKTTGSHPRVLHYLSSYAKQLIAIAIITRLYHIVTGIFICLRFVILSGTTYFLQILTKHGP